MYIIKIVLQKKVYAVRKVLQNCRILYESNVLNQNFNIYLEQIVLFYYMQQKSDLVKFTISFSEL